MATQASTLKVTGCTVDTQSITISFSEPISNPGNYTVFAPNSGLITAGVPPQWSPTPVVSPNDQQTIVMGGTTSLTPGDSVLITVSNVIAVSGDTIVSEQIPGRVPSTPVRQVRDVEDAISYPVLTEEVAYRPSSPVGIPTTGAGGIAGPGASNIGQVAMQAVTDVLGWKVNPADPKGFLGALTQSFNLKDVEGHVESSWVPRTYAVQTDLGGGITGAQASLYLRAKDALDQSLSLLDGLYPLDPDADPEYVRALREMARSQMTEIVKELGVIGVPSILRINTYFKILLGQDITRLPAAGVRLDPDQIGGTLGDIRKEYGIYFEGNPFNNSVEDEQDITNFRVISDYMTSLSQSWIANRKFFEIESKQPAFFGTQLVLISRQFNVIAETINEVKFALDSVFIGPNERQTLLLKFPHRSKFPSMYLEDVLDEVDSFVSDEGPRLLRDGGKISVANNILPVVRDLKDMIELTRDQKDEDVPKGFRTARVRRAMDDLQGQLDQLTKLTEQVEQKLPTPLTDLVISRISVVAPQKGSTNWRISIFGNAFDPAAEVAIYSPATLSETLQVEYFSSQRIDVSFNPLEANDQGVLLGEGDHDIEVTNPDGQFAVLSPAFNWNKSRITPLGKGETSGKRRARFATLVSVDGITPWGEGNAFSSSASSSTGLQAAKPATPPPAPPAPAAPASPQVSQQLKDLQDKSDAAQKELVDLKSSHDELSKKVDGIQSGLETLSDNFAAMQKSHESVAEKIEGWGAKFAGFFEGKEKKPKGKDE
jgi:hypothetical protein